MPARAPRFDEGSVRASWDAAADVYAEGQANGRDYYRYEFFGPAQIELCGVVSGLRVIDVGCGNGYFSRAMATRGAAVVGVDISPRMIEFAQQTESKAPLGIDYRVLDAAALPANLEPGSFDLATSCMALQDMPDIPRVLAGVRALLRERGRFVSSIVHPCTDTPLREWALDDVGTKRWLCIDRYFERMALQYTWLGWAREFTTEGLHATLEDWFAWIRDAGFTLRDLKEPRPTAEALRSHPDLEDAVRVPYYLFFDMERGR